MESCALFGKLAGSVVRRETHLAMCMVMLQFLLFFKKEWVRELPLGVGHKPSAVPMFQI